MEPSECCGRTCWEAGWRGSGDKSGSYQCPATAEVRGIWDTHDCGDKCAEQSECCVPSCGLSAFADESMCAAGATFRGERHECWSSEARSSGACTESDCCRQTCSGAGYTDGGAASCPEGMVYRTEYSAPSLTLRPCCAEHSFDAEGTFHSSTCFAGADVFDPNKIAELCPDNNGIGLQHIFRDCRQTARDANMCHNWGGDWSCHECDDHFYGYYANFGYDQCPSAVIQQLEDEAASGGQCSEVMATYECRTGGCSDAECCGAPSSGTCWDAGFRDSSAAAVNGTVLCPVGQMVRGQEDGHICSGGACFASECCGAQCWSSGWRDHGDDSGSRQCPASRGAARGIWDHHSCSDGLCDEDECCKQTCQDAFDYAQCAALGMINHYMTYPGEACWGHTCEPHDCCREMPTPDRWTCWYHGDDGDGWRNAGDTASGGTKFCPAGTQARWEWDHHCMGGWCGDFPESECCVRTCWEAGWRDPREVGSGEIGSGDVGSGEGG